MANIRQLEQNTPLPIAPENDTDATTPAPMLPSRTLDPALLRQFVQLLSQQQGQLPAEQAQKLQPLLRQLAPLLEQPSAEPTTQGTANATQPAIPSSAAPLQQLLQRVWSLLPGSDPLLRQTIVYGERASMPLAQLQQQPQILPELLARLPPLLQESSAPGRALNQWLLQLVTLRTPPLALQSSGHQPLKTQLLQVEIALPSIALLNDKRGQAQLQLLTKETLQLLARAAVPVTQSTAPTTDASQITGELSSVPADKLSTAARPTPSQSAPPDLDAPGKTTTGSELKEKITAALTRIAPSWLAGKQSSDTQPQATNTSAATASSQPLPTSQPALATHALMPSKAGTVAIPLPGHEEGQGSDDSLTSSGQTTQPKIASSNGLAPQPGKPPIPHYASLLTANSKTQSETPPQATTQVPAKHHGVMAPDAKWGDSGVAKHALPVGMPPALSHAELVTAVLSQPFGEFTHQLQQQVTNTSLPSPLRPLLLQLSALLQQPLTSELAVREWIQFLRAPIGDTSSMGRAMRQWGVTLLAIRFGLQGKLDEVQQQHISQQLSLSLQNMAADETVQTLGRLTSHFLGQVDRLQQQADPQQPLPNYIPLPSLHPGGREGSLTWQRSPGKQNPYQWSLNFYLEPAGLGAVQVRACLDIPDIQLQVTAEKLATVDRVKQTLPQLESRFRELGLTPTAMGCRQGKITPPPQAANSDGGDGLSIHI
ncbi:MAG: flagellar hook-length control protein FliK [Aeromonadaceae bacterium]